MKAPTADAIKPGRIPIRDVSLYVDVVGHGRPLLLMHGAPGAAHWTLQPFRQCADQFTLIFYDRSTGCDDEQAGEQQAATVEGEGSGIADPDLSQGPAAD